MTQNKSHLLLDHYLKQLKLPTMLREYAAVVTACTQDHCDYVTRRVFPPPFTYCQPHDHQEREALRRCCDLLHRSSSPVGSPGHTPAPGLPVCH